MNKKNREKIIIRIHLKSIILAVFFLLEVVFQFNIYEGQAAAFLFLECIMIVLLLFAEGIRVHSKSLIMNIYILFIFYRIFTSILISGFDISSMTYLIYSEFGIVVFLIYLVNDSFDIAELTMKIRNVGFAFGILGVIEYILKNGLFMKLINVGFRKYMEYSVGTSYFRIRLIFLHPIICGVFMVAFWCCLIFKPYRNKFLNYICGIVLVISLIGTKSRSSWVSFLICTIVFWGNKIFHKKIYVSRTIIFETIFVIAMFVLFLILNSSLLFTMMSEVITRFSDGLNADNAANYNRVKMIINGIKEWLNYEPINLILGKGSGYALLYLQGNTINGWDSAVDNQYVTVLMNYGVIGIILLFSLIYMCIYSFLKLGTSEGKCWSMILMSIFISGFFYDFTAWIMVTTLMVMSICIINQCMLKELL